jgi:flagellar biosynthetic protein FliQ
MTSVTAVAIGISAMKTALLLSGPVLIFSLVIGLLISILQAATQIQEMTLTFVPKILAAVLAVVIFGPWMLRLIVSYTTQLISNIPMYVR